MFKKYLQYRFMFEELVKRDFKKKYKRTILGMGWSMLSPLFHLLIMRLVFTNFFGRNIPHYTTYLFAGNLFFSFFREATNGGKEALLANRELILKIKVPKYLFLLSKNVSALINFGLTLIVFFIFVALDGIPFSFRFFAVFYPVGCLVLINIGVGLVLSALFVFFRDIGYLYDIFTQLLMYVSAIFYQVDAYPEKIQRLFLLNPVYDCIKYVRVVVLNGEIPSVQYHILLLFYSLFFLTIGSLMYKKWNHRFVYYL